MSLPLLNFDDLVTLAKHNPQALETVRQQACAQLIASASPAEQRRLKGLQFKIDMERRRARSTSATCMRLSEMMNDSFAQLKGILSQTQSQLPSSASSASATTASTPVQMPATDNIFLFPVH